MPDETNSNSESEKIEKALLGVVKDSQRMLARLGYPVVALTREQWERVLAALQIAEDHYYQDDDHVRQLKISEISDSISADLQLADDAENQNPEK